MSIARVYSDQTLFDEPTRAVMNVTTSPAALIISKLIPADSGRKMGVKYYSYFLLWDDQQILNYYYAVDRY